jgi:hypothetical protein
MSNKKCQWDSKQTVTMYNCDKLARKEIKILLINKLRFKFNKCFKWNKISIQISTKWHINLLLKLILFLSFKSKRQSLNIFDLAALSNFLMKCNIMLAWSS